MRKNLVYGDEPYLIDKFRRELISRVEVPDFNLLETAEFAEEEKQFIARVSLFGGDRIMIFRADTLSDCATAVEYATKSKSDVQLYVFCKNVDKRKKVYKSFAAEERKVFNKYSAEKLRNTILQYVNKEGCKITQEAYERYLELLNYFSEETNLYDVLHSLERLVSFKEITREVVDSIVMDNGTEDVFSLIQLLSECKSKEAFRQADLILKNQKSNVIGTLALLLRNYRLAYKVQACKCSLSDLDVSYRTFLPRLSVRKCHEAMNIIESMINRIKQGYYLPEVALRLTIAKLCQLQSEEQINRSSK